MTPLQIQMMLHYYTIIVPYALNEPEHAASIAVKEQRRELVSMEMLRVACGSGSSYTVTDKGKVYIAALCDMPLPVCNWVIPERNKS